MKTRPTIAALAFLCLLPACSRTGVKPSMPVPLSASVLSGQEGKDRVVIEEAGKIAQEWPEAKPHTDAQIKAVKAAPASDVAKLDAQWRAVVADRDATIAKLEKKAAEADAKFHRTVRYSLAAAGFFFTALTIAGGIMFAKFAVLFSWFGRDVLILTGALSASAWFTSLAYGWAVSNLNWIMLAAGLIIFAIGVLVYSNMRHERLSKIDAK